jgi:DNA-directed RNA polymerase subunit RPC12/RpoP
MTNEEIAGKGAKLKNLPQYRNKSNEEIEAHVKQQADKATQKEERVASAELMKIEDQFSDIKEKRMGRALLDKYLEDFSLDNISDKALLKDLIYLEVFQKMRLQTSADQFQKENGSVPLQILDAIHKNLDKIRDLKNSLGLTSDSQNEKNDAFKAFETLLKKAKNWRETNQATRTLRCPECSKMIMLRIRTDDWEAQKHPYFSDPIFGNAHLIKLYQEGKITKEDVASVLGTSPDYCDWLVNKWKILKKC